MTGRTLRDSRGAESPRTARGENVTRDCDGTRAGESERRRTRRTEGRKARRNYTHHRCSAFSIGSSAWNPSCPSLAVARTTTTTTVATSSSSSSSAFCALRLVLRRDDLPRSIVGFFFLPFRTLTTLRVPRSSSRDRFSRARFAHYLVGSIARIAVARSLARRSRREKRGRGGGEGLKRPHGPTDYPLARALVRSFVRTARRSRRAKRDTTARGTLSRKRQVSLVTRTILICNPRRSNGDRTLRTPPHPTSPLPMDAPPPTSPSFFLSPSRSHSSRSLLRRRSSPCRTDRLLLSTAFRCTRRAQRARRPYARSRRAESDRRERTRCRSGRRRECRLRLVTCTAPPQCRPLSDSRGSSAGSPGGPCNRESRREARDRGRGRADPTIAFARRVAP